MEEKPCMSTLRRKRWGKEGKGGISANSEVFNLQDMRSVIFKKSVIITRGGPQFPKNVQIDFGTSSSRRCDQVMNL